jgi:hypothetical protein
MLPDRSGFRSGLENRAADLFKSLTLAMQQDCGAHSADVRRNGEEVILALPEQRRTESEHESTFLGEGFLRVDIDRHDVVERQVVFRAFVAQAAGCNALEVKYATLDSHPYTRSSQPSQFRLSCSTVEPSFSEVSSPDA